MSDVPETRLSLLLRLRDRGDSDAWTRFVDLYGPLVYGLARRHGLGDADAADRMQEVLLAVARGVESYDARRGPFRNWLYTVTMNKLRSFWKSRRSDPDHDYDAALRESDPEHYATRAAPDADTDSDARSLTAERRHRCGAERHAAVPARGAWRAVHHRGHVPSDRRAGRCRLSRRGAHDRPLEHVDDSDGGRQQRGGRGRHQWPHLPDRRPAVSERSGDASQTGVAALGHRRRLRLRHPGADARRDRGGER